MNLAQALRPSALALTLTLSLGALPAAADATKAFALTVATDQKLPVYAPRGELEAFGANAVVTLLPTLGEGMVVQRVLDVAPELMGVDAREGAQVKEALARRYAELADDPRWADVDSPMVQAFASTAPTMLVSPPHAPGADAATAPVVLFLHGYGGNGLLFSWLLSEAMPEAWIVAPSHGLTWSRPNLRYLDDALSTFEAHRGGGPFRYHLVGLSDGAVGAFEVLAARAARVETATIIAGTPREATIKRLPRSVPLPWSAGRTARLVGAPRGGEMSARVRRRLKTTSLTWMADGHYFLLNDDGDALSIIRRAIGVGD